jgi:rare lipoprotein A
MKAVFSSRSPLPHLLFGVLLCLGFTQCRSTQTTGNPYEQRGLASWIHDRYHGRLTAFGTVYDRNAFTASSPTLPYGTAVRVTHLGNGRSVDVVVTDRFSYPGRVINLSPAAAAQIGLLQEQLAEVSVVPLQTNGPAQGAGFSTQPNYFPARSGSSGRPALLPPYNPNKPPPLSRQSFSVLEPPTPNQQPVVSCEDAMDFDFDEVIRSSLFDPPSFENAGVADFTRPNYEVQGNSPLPSDNLVAR